MSPAASSNPNLDELMERASRALASTEYFEAERLAERGLERALRSRDYDRMARICMPLQEARRQRRLAAADAGFRGSIKSIPGQGLTLERGCYLLEPPLVGADARAVRGLAAKQRVPVLLLVKEPTTSAGKWPIVGVGGGQPYGVVVRMQVAPPPGGTPDASWFLATQEALGDAAIARIDPAWPADHRVEDFIEYLEAVPEHEKLHQALEAACRQAAAAPPSPQPRRRGGIGDPNSF